LASLLSRFGTGGSIIPPLEKGGEGGLEKANKERRDIELLIIYKISPYPSLLKRGTQLVPDILIIPLYKREVLSFPRWNRGFYHPPVEKGALIPPPFLPHFSSQSRKTRLIWSPGGDALFQVEGEKLELGHLLDGIADALAAETTLFHPP